MKKYIILFLVFFVFSASSDVNCRNKYSVSRKRANSKITVILDPGHGGKDRGTRSLDRKYEEKTLNLKTALAARKYLQRMGYRVIMTRTKDASLSLEKRVSIAEKYRSRVFVSIHYNSAPGYPNANGVEVYYCSKRAKKLASLIHNRVVCETKAKARKVTFGKFYVIRNTSMPAVLLEGGFMDHPKEMQKLKRTSYLDKIGLGIAKGIDAYLH